METTTNRLGYYVHHHGRGHRQRAELILNRIDVPVRLLSSTDCNLENNNKQIDIIKLPLDFIPGKSAPNNQVSFLHYSPVKNPLVKDRTRILTNSLDQVRLLVVDVSVEIAMLARLLSIPTVIFRMHGDRFDTAHLNAYESAELLIAPYHRRLEQADVPAWVKKKTVYSGGFSKYTNQTIKDKFSARNSLGLPMSEKICTISTSLGGNGLNQRKIKRIIKNSPDWTFVKIGKNNLVDSKNTIDYGVVDSTLDYIASADLVISSSGHNSVMEIADINRPALLIPENRPYNEQAIKAKRLEDEKITPTIDNYGDSDSLDKILEEIQSNYSWRGTTSSKSVERIRNELENLYNTLVW